MLGGDEGEKNSAPGNGRVQQGNKQALHSWLLSYGSNRSGEGEAGQVGWQDRGDTLQGTGEKPQARRASTSPSAHFQVPFSRIRAIVAMVPCASSPATIERAVIPRSRSPGWRSHAVRLTTRAIADSGNSSLKIASISASEGSLPDEQADNALSTSTNATNKKGFVRGSFLWQRAKVTEEAGTVKRGSVWYGCSQAIRSGPAATHTS